MSTGFGLFRNSNFLTCHERVVNSYISVFMYIHLLYFAEDSYQESKPQAAQAHYLWVGASEVIWWEYTRIISVLSDAKQMQKVLKI